MGGHCFPEMSLFWSGSKSSGTFVSAEVLDLSMLCLSTCKMSHL